MPPFVGRPGQYVILYSALLGSMLAGASAVQWLLAPDTRLPAVPAPAAGGGGGGGAGASSGSGTGLGASRKGGAAE